MAHQVRWCACAADFGGSTRVEGAQEMPGLVGPLKNRGSTACCQARALQATCLRPWSVKDRPVSQAQASCLLVAGRRIHPGISPTSSGGKRVQFGPSSTVSVKVPGGRSCQLCIIMFSGSVS